MVSRGLVVGPGSLCRLGVWSVVGSWLLGVVSGLLLVGYAVSGCCGICVSRGCLGGREIGEGTSVVAVGCLLWFAGLCRCSEAECDSGMLVGEGGVVCVD